jgi:hypothetical protein
VDSTEAITELNEGNNQLSSIYPKMVVAVTAQENALIKNASPEMEPGPPVAVEQVIGSAAGPAAGISSKRIPVKGPAIRLNATSMMAPAKVKLIVQPDPDFKVKYVLEKKENGVFREIASSDRPEFQVAEPGDYQVKAQYAGGGFGKPTAFTVTPGKVTAPPVSPAPAVTAPKQPLKTPVKSKKIMP